jgi:hypothetical protein
MPAADALVCTCTATSTRIEIHLRHTQLHGHCCRILCAMHALTRVPPCTGSPGLPSIHQSKNLYSRFATCSLVMLPRSRLAGLAPFLKPPAAAHLCRCTTYAQHAGVQAGSQSTYAATEECLLSGGTRHHSCAPLISCCSGKAHHSTAPTCSAAMMVR